MSDAPADSVLFMDAQIDRALDRLEAGMGPVWEGQAEMARTLVTLSGGALVLTVSLVQLLADKIGHPGWSWLLPTSWVFFGTSIVAGVVRHGWTSRARGMRARFELSRGELRKRLRTLSVDEKWSDNAEAVANELLAVANADPAHAVKIHDRLMVTSAWSFIFGIGFLLTFAIRNLPW